MDVGDEIRNLIHGRAAEAKIAAAAQAAGLKSMREDGERLVEEGITSLEEVVRVTRNDDTCRCARRCPRGARPAWAPDAR